MWNPFEKPAMEEPEKKPDYVEDPKSGVVMNPDEYKEMKENEDRNNP